MAPEVWLEILQLHQRYVASFDGGNIDGLGECFIEDAVFDSLPNLPNVPFPATGRRAIVEAIRSQYEELQPQQTLHFCGNPLVLEDVPNRVRTWSALIVLRSMPGEVPIVSVAGGYEDQVVLQPDGKWRFSARTVHREKTAPPGAYTRA